MAPACVRRLVVTIRLRNLLVDRCWAIDDERVHKGVRKDFICVEELLSVVCRRLAVM
ncbi:hypothetical protein [Pyrobaculum ferrireducens]|uniref:Uncharacterized protein n=1 Tax=Pyrobaculum ferrireducens TaxID=1104324 RepID=G7VC64_9CREN|nr:hypothetical protein [Pyrobaculum ferrireducens]AET33750.1 hypothetical protein P186_2362 [Pyrobaculum ferrireducens]